MAIKLKLYFFLLIVTLCNTAHAEKICIVADWDQNERTFFKRGSVYYKLRSALKKRGHELVLMEEKGNFKNATTLVVFNQPLDVALRNAIYAAVPVANRFLYLWEPPSVHPHSYCACHHKFYSKVFTWKDDLVDNHKYFKFYYPSLLAPMIEDRTSFKSKILCTQISGNKHSPHPDELYSERRKVIDFFEANHPNDFIFYGILWPEKTFKTYGGAPASKTETLDRFKFSICYENIKNIEGYVTEKIFDCFYAGCVPIYWGASNITQYVPSECFIDRRNFNSYEELYQFMKAMPKDTYKQYLKNIEAYLNSTQAYPYTPEFFVENFIAQHGF